MAAITSPQKFFHYFTFNTDVNNSLYFEENSIKLAAVSFASASRMY